MRYDRLFSLRGRSFLPFLLLVFMGSLACQSGKEQFLIEGNLENAALGQTVVLYEGDRKLDSVFVDEQGKFRLRRVAAQPRLFTLHIGKQQYPLILKNGDAIRFQANLHHEEGHYEVSGSALSEKIRDFAGIQLELRKFQQQLDTDFSTLAANLNEQAIMAMRGEFLEKYRNYMKGYVAQTFAFAQANPDLAGFYAMSTLEPEFAEAELIQYAEQIEGKFEQNALVQTFMEQVGNLKRLAVGQPAPAFESRTAQNKLVKLEDFRGQYTLIDFWASWCMPCREENPNLLKQYRSFKDKGFTILGVSLDGNPGSWLRAVEEDGLEWIQVSDLQAWKSPLIELYSIKAIPTSYLIDPNGIILAKNLRGQELETYLKTLFEEGT